MLAAGRGAVAAAALGTGLVGPAAAAVPRPADFETRLGGALRDLVEAQAQGRVESLGRERAIRLRAGPAGHEVEVVVETAGAADAARDALERAGARVDLTAASRARAWVPVARLGDLAAVPAALAVRLPFRPTPAVTSAGVALTGADRMHAAGLRGQNVRVGILDSFDGWAAKQGNELPPAERLTFRSFLSGNGDGDDAHGVRVAEIVADMAPDAHLYLAAIEDDVGYARAIDWMIGQGVRVINHSGGFGLLGDLRGQGPIHSEIAIARASGVFYVAAAGNYGRTHWQGDFLDSDGDGWHEFRPGIERLSFQVDATSPDLRIDLTWDDWLPDPNDPRPTTDYDLCLYGPDGGELACSRDRQTGGAGQFPYEVLSFKPARTGGHALAVRRVSGAGRWLELGLIPSWDFGPFALPESSLIVPSDSPFAFTVGATSLEDLLRDYSSRGPTNDGRLKPDLVAPDGVATSLGGFFGTSAAAPHLAGAAALLLSRDPNMGPGEIGDRLREAAIQVASDPVPGPDNSFGHGRLNANLPGSGPAPTPTPAATPVRPGPGGGGGGCRLVAPGEPGAALQLLLVVLGVVLYATRLGRR